MAAGNRWSPSRWQICFPHLLSAGGLLAAAPPGLAHRQQRDPPAAWLTQMLEKLGHHSWAKLARQLQRSRANAASANVRGRRCVVCSMTCPPYMAYADDPGSCQAPCRLALLAPFEQ